MNTEGNAFYWCILASCRSIGTESKNEWNRAKLKQALCKRDFYSGGHVFLHFKADQVQTRFGVLE